MIISEATKSDIIALGEFATQAFYDAYGWYNTPENMREYVLKHFSAEQLLKEISDPSTHYILAKEDDKIFGYAKLGLMGLHPDLIPESHSEIERIYVDTKLQRKGIGKKLLLHLKELASIRKNSCLWLGVWQKNENAIRFYQNIGFEIIGTTQFLLGDDLQEDFLMKLDLNKMS